MIVKIEKKEISVMIVIYIFAFFILYSIPAMAQVDKSEGLTAEKLLPQFNKMTPEAASLQKFGSFNVSEYSGTANIRIPLYTINNNDVSIPIELYYDASGIKVEQDATFVGLGWNLNYGGCINHIICGYDDFMENPHYSANQFSEYWAGKSLPSSEPTRYFNQYHTNLSFWGVDGSVDACAPKDAEGYWMHYELENGYHAPDIFNANFCGQSLSFVIDKRYADKIVILNDGAHKYSISVTYDQSKYPHYPKTFIITDDQGINYMFDAFREFDKYDSYYLTAVYGADGIDGKNTVKYIYNQEYFDVAQSRANMKEINSKGKVISDYSDNVFPLNQQLQTLTSGKTEFMKLSQSEAGYCYKVLPSMIISKLDTVYFYYKDRDDILGAKSLSGIEIKGTDGSYLDKINLS